MISFVDNLVAARLNELPVIFRCIRAKDFIYAATILVIFSEPFKDHWEFNFPCRKIELS